MAPSAPTENGKVTSRATNQLAVTKKQTEVQLPVDCRRVKQIIAANPLANCQIISKGDGNGKGDRRRMVMAARLPVEQHGAGRL